MVFRALLTFALLVIASAAVGAEDYAALFEEAINNIDWDFQDEWAYTETAVKEDKLTIGSYDPRRDEDERWQLISVDGREPTAKETREYIHDRGEHDTASDSRTTKIVGAESLEMLEETDDFWMFTFVPDDEEEAFIQSVDATVKIIKAGRYVESIDIRNHSDIKPGFGTKLSKLWMRLEFGPAADGGPVVPQSIKTHVTGRALFFIGIDDTEATSHSDFEHVEVSRIEALADEFLAATLERYPAMGTYYSINGARHDRLFDNSLDALAEWQARQDTWLDELNAIGSPGDIGSRDWVTYGIMHEALESSVATRICRNELWQASGATGWHRGLPFIFEIQPVDTPELQQQALDRLGEVARYIDGEIANLRLGLESGYSAPRVTVEVVPEQVRTLISDDSIFLNPAVRADNAEFLAEVRAVYDTEIVPAINRFADFIESVYLDQAREDTALSANQDGTECYPARVRSFVTIQPPAEEIHAVGLEQIEHIRGEMQVTIDEHFGGGSIETFLRRINNEPEFTFESEEAVVQFNVDALDAAREAMRRVFGRLPKADVLVKPYPEFAESGSGEYHSSSEDGTRPGIFYIAVTDPQHRSRSTQKSTLYHETFPGHHHQGAISLELGDRVHPIARYFWNSGFGEGWALYSERLADELGLYSDPLDHIGLYSDQGARAARLVIDTGLHTKGWTRQQAVDYMMSNTSWSDVDIQNEIDRYISWPGQATAYMLGMLEIRRLRTLAEKELGEQFDLSAFHDRVVGYGGITLPMLHVSILAWIEEQKGAS